MMIVNLTALVLCAQCCCLCFHLCFLQCSEYVCNLQLSELVQTVIATKCGLLKFIYLVTTRSLHSRQLMCLSWTVIDVISAEWTPLQVSCSSVLSCWTCVKLVYCSAFHPGLKSLQTVLNVISLQSFEQDVAVSVASSCPVFSVNCKPSPLTLWYTYLITQLNGYWLFICFVSLIGSLFNCTK